MDTSKVPRLGRKRCYNNRRSTTQSLETGHGNDGYIDSGEQVLESLGASLETWWDTGGHQ